MTASGNPEVAANLERAHESLEAARTLVEAELFDDATSRAGETRHVTEAEATRALETAERLVEALSRLAGTPPA